MRPLGTRFKDAAVSYGSRELLRDCVRAGWIKPRVDRKREVIFDTADLSACWERICEQGPPPRAARIRKERSAK